MANITHPRDFLATEKGRVAGSLLDLEHVLAAESDEALFMRVDAYADDLIKRLSSTIDRIKRAKTAVAAARLLAEPVKVEVRRAA